MPPPIRIIPLPRPPQKKEAEKTEPSDRLSLFDLLSNMHVKGAKGDTPKKGVDYFTPQEIAEFRKAVTPIKGKHYFDGQKGEKGDPSTVPGPQGPAGIDGSDADEEVIVKKVMARIIPPKDGKDGEIPDFRAFKDEIMGELKKISGKKLRVQDIEDLENRINQISVKVERNYGGHGGTMHNIVTTLVSGGTYNLASPYPVLGEMEVYVGGGRLFFENGDFTSVIAGGNRVKQIVLSAAAQASIASGASLNIRGK